VVNGRKITVSEFKRLMEAQDQGMKAMAATQPEAFLEQYALYESVLVAAEKAGLAQKSPFQERIAMSRRQILVSGYIDEMHKGFVIPEEDAKKFYDGNQDMYQQAMVRVIFLSKAAESRDLATGEVVTASTPEEIQAKAAKAAERAREGEDFAKLAKEYSDDKNTAEKGGEFPHPVRPTSANVPAHIRLPILEAKAGDIVGPIEHDTGFYVFKVLSNGIGSFDENKDFIVKQLKDARLKHWLDGFKKESSVTIENEALFREAVKTK
jgi:foldase protein PrsA